MPENHLVLREVKWLKMQNMPRNVPFLGLDFLFGCSFLQNLENAAGTTHQNRRAKIRLQDDLAKTVPVNLSYLDGHLGTWLLHVTFGKQNFGLGGNHGNHTCAHTHTNTHTECASVLQNTRADTNAKEHTNAVTLRQSDTHTRALTKQDTHTHITLLHVPEHSCRRP